METRVDQFGPDVMVVPVTDERAHFTGVPFVVVEILSSNRSHDSVRKMAKYAEAGPPRYWVLDPRDRVLIAHEPRDGLYVEAARAAGSETVRLDFGAGAIEISPAALH